MKRPNVSAQADRTLWAETTQQEKTILRSVLRALRAAKPEEYSALKTTIHVWDVVLKRRRREEEITA